MTKLLALEITAELWRWLEKHPEEPKCNWPRWSEMPKCANHCACCQYVEENTDNCFTFYCSQFNPLIEDKFIERIHEQMIELCPLKSLWPNGCESEGSPYDRWSESDNWSESSEAAKEIADAAEKEISLLIKNQKKGKT